MTAVYTLQNWQHGLRMSTAVVAFNWIFQELDKLSPTLVAKGFNEKID